MKLALRLLLIVTFVSLGGGFFYFSPQTIAAVVTPPTFRAGEVLVKIKGQDQIQRIYVDPSEDLNAIIAHYKNHPAVEYVEPNHVMTVTAFPNDPYNFEQWYLTPIKAKEAWSDELLIRQQRNINTTSVIAILDTGVDTDHPDLQENLWRNPSENPIDRIDNDTNGYLDDYRGWDFVDSDNDPNPTWPVGYSNDAVNHGTLVAGIANAVSHNRAGITGLSWFSKIMPLRVLDSTGAGDVFDVINAIDYAVDNGADVINMSFIGAEFNQSLLDALKRADQAGVVVVAAAGNTDPSVNGINLDVSRYYPVCYQGDNGKNLVIGVGSLDRSFKKSNFSNYGNCIDIVAPGEGFYTTQVYDPARPGFDNPYNGYWSGTSLSTPLVSGTVGILRALRPELSPEAIRNSILQGAQSVNQFNPDFVNRLGAGQLDVLQTIKIALDQPVSNPSGPSQNYLVAGLGFGSFPQLKIFKQDGSIFKDFFAYSPYFNGPVHIAIGNVLGDSAEEIITGAGKGGGPHVRIFNTEGNVLGQFFAYDKNFRGGITVASGDLTGDGIDEIITGSGPGMRPEVRVFNAKGELVKSFLAYAEKFLGGVKVAVGDVNGDGLVEIVTGAGNGGGPHVRIFNAEGALSGQFFAYNQDFHGGINVAAGDVNGDSIDEIVASVESNSIPTVRVFNHLGHQLANFIAYEPSQLGGVAVAIGDLTGDGVGEILTGPASGSQPLLRAFNLGGVVQLEIAAHQSSSYRGGVRPALLRGTTR